MKSNCVLLVCFYCFFEYIFHQSNISRRFKAIHLKQKTPNKQPFGSVQEKLHDRTHAAVLLVPRHVPLQIVATYAGAHLIEGILEVLHLDGPQVLLLRLTHPPSPHAHVRDAPIHAHVANWTHGRLATQVVQVRARVARAAPRQLLHLLVADLILVLAQQDAQQRAPRLLVRQRDVQPLPDAVMPSSCTRNSVLMRRVPSMSFSLRLGPPVFATFAWRAASRSRR